MVRFWLKVLRLYHVEKAGAHDGTHCFVCLFLDEFEEEFGEE